MLHQYQVLPGLIRQELPYGVFRAAPSVGCDAGNDDIGIPRYETVPGETRVRVIRLIVFVILDASIRDIQIIPVRRVPYPFVGRKFDPVGYQNRESVAALGTQAGADRIADDVDVPKGFPHVVVVFFAVPAPGSDYSYRFQY